jgi:L-serine deaminase
VTATSAVETEAAALAAKTEVQAQTVADLDRRVAQIDGVIAEMVKRGRTSSALDALATQRKQREALVGQRRHEAETLVALKSEAGAVAARTRRIEVEAAPIMYVAQLMGGTTEQAIRFLILLMVLTCDPLALALTAAASRPRWRPPARKQGATM